MRAGAGGGGACRSRRTWCVDGYKKWENLRLKANPYGRKHRAWITTVAMTLEDKFVKKNFPASTGLLQEVSKATLGTFHTCDSTSQHIERVITWMTCDSSSAPVEVNYAWLDNSTGCRDMVSSYQVLSASCHRFLSVAHSHIIVHLESDHIVWWTFRFLAYNQIGYRFPTVRISEKYEEHGARGGGMHHGEKERDGTRRQK